MQIVLMRHGRVPGNEEHRYVGATDEHLSAAGRDDARAAGICEQVERVCVSPLARARETARICFPRAEQVVCDGLREMDFGAFEGRNAREMEADAAYRRWVEGGCVDACPGGESRAQLMDRVAACLSSLVHEAHARGERRLVVVGHGGTIMSAMEAFVPDDESDAYRYFSWQVGNCCGYAVQAEEAAGSLRFASFERFDSLSFLNA